MSYEGFSKGYDHAEPGVDEETINEAWYHGDSNGDGWLDYEEFMTLVESAEEQYEHEDYMTASDYWHEATSNHARGMSRREFSDLYREHDEDVSTQEVREAFEHGDENEDNRLDHDEFVDLVEEMEEHEGDHEGGNDGEEEIANAWANYSNGEHVDRDAYGNVFRHYFPEASDEEIDGGFWISDVNEDGVLDWDEFHRSAMLSGGPPEEGKAQWYWDMFSEEGHIDFAAFHRGSMIENPGTPEEELQGMFDSFDSNADGLLDHDEFWAMIEGGEE